jgi:hypothetical protein
MKDKDWDLLIYRLSTSLNKLKKAHEQIPTDTVAFVKTIQQLLTLSVGIVQNLPKNTVDGVGVYSNMVGAWRRIAEYQQSIVADQIEALVFVRESLQKVQREWSKRRKRTPRLLRNGRVSQQSRKHKSRSSRKQ